MATRILQALCRLGLHLWRTLNVVPSDDPQDEPMTDIIDEQCLGCGKTRKRRDPAWDHVAP